MEGFSHLNAQHQAAMVDVTGKTSGLRTATAQARIRLSATLYASLQGGELYAPKGPVFHTAMIAGTMAAKRTSDLIPLCHPLPLEDCKLELNMSADGAVVIHCRVGTTHKTGVEMEALTGASVAALTVYDMCKAFGHDMVIEAVCLLEKTGGKRDFRRPEPVRE